MHAFEFCETQDDGTPKGVTISYKRASDVRLRISLLCPKITKQRFERYMELALAAPNGPGVDVTHWEEVEGERRMIFSARLRYVRSA